MYNVVTVNTGANMSNKQVQKITDWDLEDYFDDDEQFQEFLEMFEREYDKELIVREANAFAEEHDLPLQFVSVDLEAEPDQFVWEVIVDENGDD
jgi:hypothetical protein